MVSMQVAALALAISGVSDAVLLDFQADWCGPCRQMEPTVSQLSAAGYPVRKINIDQERELANRYNVSGIPCFVLVANGKEVDRVVGATSLAQLQAMFAKANAAGGDEVRGQSPDGPLRRIGQGMLGRRGADVQQRDVQQRDQQHPASSPAVSMPVAFSHGPQQGLQNSSQPAVQPAQLLAASVRLTIEDQTGFSYGSGTLIDSRAGEALILTCGHVFRDSQGKGKITVDLFGPGAPQKLPARLVSYDLTRDIGLVSVRPGVPVSVARVAPKGHRVAPGDAAMSVGCNNGADPTVRSSKIKSVDRYAGPANVEAAGMPVQGRSGGGLFSADGLVIGVCNAADEKDDEGLYAAAATIQAQLDQAGLSAIYAGSNPGPNQGPDKHQAPPAFGAPAFAANAPRQMPLADAAPLTPVDFRQPAGRQNPTAADDLQAAAVRNASLANLSPSEQATLTQLQSKAQSAEVICIVRPLADSGAKSEVIVLDRASSAFLQQLASERHTQDSRRLTSLEVPRGTPATAFRSPEPSTLRR